jgi:hypothetical protein
MDQRHRSLPSWLGAVRLGETTSPSVTRNSPLKSEPGQTDWPSPITGGGRCAVQPPGTIEPMTELRITVPVEIAERLASEAAERGTSAEDVAAEVLRLHAAPGSGGHRYGFIGIAKAKPGAPSAAEAEQLLENYQDEEFAR